MKALIFDTSTKKSFVAIVTREKTLASMFLEGGKSLSAQISSAIEKLFLETELTKETLTFIAPGIGPGSYTGIRVGITIAKTLSFAWKTPLIGFSSLYGFVPENEGTFASLIDAKSGGIYLALGEKKRKGSF